MLKAVLLGYSLAGFALSPATAYLGKGNQLMQAERYDEAAAQFSQALSYDKTLQEARKNLAICDFEIRDYKDARALFESLAAGRDHVLAAYYLARLDIRDDHLDSAIKRLQNNSFVDAKYFLGIAYFKRGLYQEAIQSLRTYIEQNPRDFRAHQWLARSLQKSGLAEEANREFQRTRELHEYYTDGSVAIGRCRSLLSDGKTDQAWAACKPMLQTDDVDKIAAIGMLFGQINDQPHALQAWQAAIALDPGSPEINYNLALAYFQVRNIQDSLKYARKAFELWPAFPEANVLYGTILYMTGPDAEAGRVLRHALALRPDDANVSRLLAELQARSKAR